MTRLERFKFNMVLLKAIIWSYMVDAWIWVKTKEYKFSSRYIIYILLPTLLLYFFANRPFYDIVGYFVVWLTIINIVLNWLDKKAEKYLKGDI